MSKGCLKCGALNADDARFCRQCGTAMTAATADPAATLPGADARAAASLGAAFAPPARRQPLALWAALAAVLIVLIAGAVWWFNSTREPSGPTFDSAPPPSVAGASGVASMPAEAVAPPAPDARSSDAPSAPSSDASTAAHAEVPPSPAASASAAAVDLAPASPGAQAVSESAPPAGPVTPAAASTSPPVEPSPAATPDPNAREARAKALREQRAKRAAQAASQAEAANLATRRAEEARARAAAPAPVPAPAPAPRPAPPVSQPRTVQERCGNENGLLRSMCEARECINREHAGEPACVRVRAAEDRRRQREGGG